MSEFQENAPATAKPRRRKGWMIGVGVVALLVGGGTLAAPYLLDQAKYKALIQEKVTEATGYSVDWKGNIGISILPLPGVNLNELTVLNGKTQILQLKEAEVRVALMPLLSGNIQIESVSLDEPQVTLIVDKQGRSSWMTEKMAKGEDAAPQETQESADGGEASKPAEITLDALKINKGYLKFTNEQTGAMQEIKDLSSTIRAESMTGPFAAKGDMVYGKNKIAFDAKAGKIDGNQKSYPVSFKVELPDSKVKAEYGGVIAATDPMLVDGDVTLLADDLAKTVEALSGAKPELPDGIGGATEVKGKILFDGTKAALSNLRVAVGELAYTGSVAVNDLKADAPALSVNLVPQPNNKDSASSPLVAALKDLAIKGMGTYKNGQATIKDGEITFRGQKIDVDGSFSPAQGEGRPTINLAVRANTLNADELTGSTPEVKPAKATLAKDEKGKALPAADAKSLQGMSLPFDGQVKANIAKLIFGGQAYTPLNADIVSKGNALTINSLTVGGVEGANISAKGRIGDLAALSGIDLTASVQVADADALLQKFKVEKPEALPKKIGAASLNGAFKGSLESLAFDGTVSALKFGITAKGTVAQPMKEPKVDKVALRIQHPQFVEAIRTFQPGFAGAPSFRGPLDLSAAIDLDGSKYKVSGIKGNLGSTSVAGNLDLSTGGSRPSAAGALNFGDLVFDATKSGGSSSGASSGGGSSAPASSGERWSTAPIDTAWMKSFDADLTIKANSITQDYWKLNNANLSFAMNDGALTVRDLSAGMFGGSVLMNGEVKSGSPVALKFAMNAKNVDARQLQSALTSKVSDTLNGTIASVVIDISSSGSSVAALVNALSGKGTMEGRNIIIKGIDVAQLAETAKGSFKPLERAGSLFGSFQNGQTQFDTFDATFPIAQGVANFTQLTFDGPRAKIDGKGTVNLPRWTIDLTNTVTVKGTDIPPFDVTIKGPLDNPLQAGGNIIEDYLRAKAQKKIEKLLVNEIEKRFGGGKAADAVAPAADGTVATEPAPKASKEEKAIKALQGLFGQ